MGHSLAHRVSIEQEFQQLTGGELPPRKVNMLRCRLPRADDLFRRIGILCFDRPKSARRLERRLRLWLAERPGEEGIWALAGYVYYCQGRYPHAQRAFLRAIELSPDNLDNWIDLAMTLRHLDDPLGTDILLDHRLYLRAYKRMSPKTLDRRLLSRLRESVVRNPQAYRRVYRKLLPPGYDAS